MWRRALKVAVNQENIRLESRGLHVTQLTIDNDLVFAAMNGDAARFGTFDSQWVKDLPRAQLCILHVVYQHKYAQGCRHCGMIEHFSPPEPENINHELGHSCCTRFSNRSNYDARFLSIPYPYNALHPKDMYVCRDCAFVGGNTKHEMFQHMLKKQDLPPEYRLAGYSKSGLQDLKFKFNFNYDVDDYTDPIWQMDLTAARTVVKGLFGLSTEELQDVPPYFRGHLEEYGKAYR